MRRLVLSRALVALLILSLVWVSCSNKEEEFKLAEDSPAYQLAVDLAKLIPALHPDLNRVMVVTLNFKLTSGELIQNIVDKMGNQSQQLKEFLPAQLKEFMEREARVQAERRMLLDKARQVEINVSTTEVEQAFLQQASRAGGEEKYLELLESQNLNLDHVKNRIRFNIIIQRFIQLELGSDFPATEKEVEIVYNQDKTATVRHILLRSEGKTVEEKRQIRDRMEGILSMAKAGEDFADLARKYTEDLESKGNGGLNEDFGRGVMLRPFEHAAFTLPPGEISGIIETAYGFHILKIINRKKENRPLDDVRAGIVTQIKQAKQGQAFFEYMTRLKEQNNYQLNAL